jgi:glutamyl-tRNA reductase
MVLGEPQILGQDVEAYTLAPSAGSTGLVLSRLFQCAIHAAKRSHHETSISTNPATVSSVAVHLIASILKPLENASVLVVGAGEMAELAVEALRKRGVKAITV